MGRRQPLDLGEEKVPEDFPRDGLFDGCHGHCVVLLKLNLNCITYQCDSVSRSWIFYQIGCFGKRVDTESLEIGSLIVNKFQHLGLTND